MLKSKKLIIVGDSAFAEVAYEYFTHDSPYEVVAFSVERTHHKRQTLFSLPIVPFENLEFSFTPTEHSVYVAVVYTQLNRLRTRLAKAAKEKGFALASYISSNACVWPNAKVGEHCFIFEQNTLQPFVTLGNNVVLWSGNHVGHHSHIGDNCFVASHVVVSGFVTIGANCFLGVNSTIINNITLGADCWIGPSATITRNTKCGELFRAPKAELAPISSLAFSGLKS